MIDNTEAAEILEQCAEELQTHGWISHMSRSDGQRCLGAVLTDLTPDYEMRAELSRYLINHVHGYTGDNLLPSSFGVISGIVHWNDKEGRTEEEVIDALIGTAKELRNKG